MRVVLEHGCFFPCSRSTAIAQRMSSNDDDIAQRTLAAKREAEKLKEKIKRKKESLADTTCKLIKNRIPMGFEAEQTYIKCHRRLNKWKHYQG